MIICGPREFVNQAKFNLLLGEIIQKKYGGKVWIVHGDALGTDTMADNYAKAKKLRRTAIPIANEDWDKFGKSAGYYRNAEMSEIGDECIAFWDGVSKGTKLMIDIAKKKNMPLEIISI